MLRLPIKTEQPAPRWVLLNSTRARLDTELAHAVEQRRVPAPLEQADQRPCAPQPTGVRKSRADLLSQPHRSGPVEAPRHRADRRADPDASNGTSRRWHQSPEDTDASPATLTASSQQAVGGAWPIG